MEKYIQYNPTMSNNGCVLRAQQEYIYVQRTILTFPEDCSALELHTFIYLHSQQTSTSQCLKTVNSDWDFLVLAKSDFWLEG